MEDDEGRSMLYKKMERQIFLFYITKGRPRIYGLFAEELLNLNCMQILPEN